ncbi:alpha/beta hydrolase [Desulforhopalus vacuolatus]|uniref:alpha/beta hydrolase n=1 Tax=Desulforhopalus vacuolatus TaxID=40414 RepID=UPI0019644F6D|nr:alpha/beta hydrolase [Desulforhopalus vacuolatus]MBM9518295.1 alpha/beta hydrolase [Desulforhopalus vacuolatus]
MRQDIYFIANSMENRASTRTYISLITENPHLKSRFTEIILAAPAIDAKVFNRKIVPAMVQADNPFTLYASSEYLALKVSKAVHGGEHSRAGDSEKYLIVFQVLKIIDSTNKRTGLKKIRCVNEISSGFKKRKMNITHFTEFHEKIETSISTMCEWPQ